jgi:RNA polymerase sigma factor (sigma-70 family)
MKSFAKTNFHQELSDLMITIARHYRYMSGDDRADLEQELRIWAFLHAESVWENLEEGRIENLPSYLRKVTYRHSVAPFKRKLIVEQFERPLGNVPEGVLATDDDPEGKIIDLIALHEQIAKLPRSEQEVIGYHLTGRSPQEIAFNLNLKEANAKQRLHRAKVHLAKLIRNLC